MNHMLTHIEQAVAALRHAGDDDGGHPVAVDELSGAELVEVAEALGALGRHFDTLRAQVAAQIDRASRRELGAESLAKQHGFRTGTALIAATGGLGSGDARRLVSVGKAIAPGRSLTGEVLPARHPHVAEAMRSGHLAQAAAAMIVTMLDRVALRSSPAERDAAEKTLVAQAPGLTVDQLRRLVAHAQAWLDQDGLEPSEQERRRMRRLHLCERDGFLIIDGQLDIATGAPVKAAIEGLVTAAMHAGDGRDGGAGDGTVDNGTVDNGTVDNGDADDGDAERPSIAQRQADALVQLAAHALGCTDGDLPLSGVSVVVRMDLETLTDGIGQAEIDGITEPISPAAARHMAASAEIIPAVLDGHSEILDWGRAKRLFTKAQRLALVERDGGCAMCGLPPGMTRAHHLNWWHRDNGRTNLCEGVLLCEGCHHRIHDNGWDVRVDGCGPKAKVWFIPPPMIDPHRRPRPGGRARFRFDAPSRRPGGGTARRRRYHAPVLRSS